MGRDGGSPSWGASNVNILILQTLQLTVVELLKDAMPSRAQSLPGWSHALTSSSSASSRYHPEPQESAVLSGFKLHMCVFVQSRLEIRVWRGRLFCRL